MTDVRAEKRKKKIIKKQAYCWRQSFLLSDWFPSMVKQWRTKITSISTKRTYRGINASAASFLPKSHPVSKLEKNCRKTGGNNTHTQAVRKIVQFQGNCRDRANWMSKYGHVTWSDLWERQSEDVHCEGRVNKNII